MPASLSLEQTQHYEQNGYLVVRNLIPGDVIEAVRARAMEVTRDGCDWGDRSFQIVDPKFLTHPDGRPIPIGIQRPANYEEVFKRMTEHPNLIASMTRLLGGDVQLFTDQLIVKHGFLDNEQGGRSYFHQDSYYWHVPPRMGCNCWIPLDDVGTDAIALAVMPRSHASWEILDHEHYYDDPPWCSMRSGEPFQRKRIPLSKIDHSREAVLTMSPGDGLFFTNYTWHRSEPNRTGQDKAFYAIAYKRVGESVSQ